MIEALTIWAYLTVAQKEGGSVQGFSTEIECQDARMARLREDSDVLLMSDCVKVTLSPRETATLPLVKP